MAKRRERVASGVVTPCCSEYSIQLDLVTARIGIEK